jgi:GntR family transcriptional regulator
VNGKAQIEPLATTYRRSRVPLYLQVAEDLRQRLAKREWQPGGKIASLEELEAEYQVARVTVRQAVDMLQKEGWVQRRQGKGTFVSHPPKDPRWLNVQATWESLISPIKDNLPQLIEVADAPAVPRLMAGEGRLADNYHFQRSLQLKGSEPFAVVNLHLARAVYELAADDFRSQTALPVLFALDGVRIRQAQQTMVIGAADTETAALLKTALNAPTVEARCVVVDEDEIAIYVAEIIYRADCVKLSINLYDDRPGPAATDDAQPAAGRRGGSESS